VVPEVHGVVSDTVMLLPPVEVEARAARGAQRKKAAARARTRRGTRDTPPRWLPLPRSNTETIIPVLLQRLPGVLAFC